MKRLARILIAATALVPVLLTTAKAEKLASAEVNRPAQAIGFLQPIDISRWDRLSAQAVYTDGTPSTFSVTSGYKSSATITVGPNPTGNIGVQASVTINILSTSAVSGDSVVIFGNRFKEGTEWSAQTSSATAAANLASHIDARPEFVATSLGSTVTVKYVQYGTAGNGIPVTTTDSTNLAISAATLTGGVNRETITVNGIVFTEGVDFNANASSQTTAINISTNINANATLAQQVVASTSALGVVLVRALYPGYSNYSLGSSTSGYLTNGGFPGGLASAVDPATDIFTQTSHGLTTGLKVLVSTLSANIAPTGLVGGTTYYAIKLNQNQYKLATTSTTAAAGTAIDITGTTDGSTFDLKPTPLSLAAGNGFYWEFSNDNVNFSTYTTQGANVSSVTYSAAGNSLWEFGGIDYNYMRVNFTGPVSGGITLLIKIFGRKD